MSADFIETIWAQYAVETEEHVEAIEGLLVKADGVQLDGEELSGLFRAFHSLKGLSRVMELTALEKIAHRAEDLLGLVREGIAGLDKPRVDLLLRALDAIKVLRAKAVAERADGELPPGLTDELQAAYQAASTGAPSPAAAAPAAPAAPAAATPAPAPATPAAPAAPAAEAPAAAAAPPKPKAAEPQPLAREQEVFFRMVRNGIPLLELLASSVAAKDDPELVFQVANDIRRPLAWMARSTQKLQYNGLSKDIRAIIDALPDSAAVAFDSRRIVNCIVDFIADLRQLGEVSGSSFGEAELGNILEETLQKSLVALLDDIASQLPAIDPSDRDAMHRVGAAFLRVHEYLSTKFSDVYFNLPLLLSDVYRRDEQAGAEHSLLLTITLEAINTIREFSLAHNAAKFGELVASERVSAINKRIQAYLWQQSGIGGEARATQTELASKLKLPQELVDLLTPENIRQIGELEAAGACAYVIDAHLESSERLASAFIEWIQSRGTIISNRSVFQQDENWYEILFFSTADRATIDRELQDIDQGQGFLKLSATAGSTGSGAAPAVSAATSTAASNTAAAPAAAPVADSAAEPAAAPPAAPSAAAGAATTAPVPKAAATPPANPPTGTPLGAAASNFIRVPGETLDQFMNQIGEMVIIRGQLSHLIGDRRQRDLLQSLRHELDGRLDDNEDFQRLMDLVDAQSRRLAEVEAQIQGALSRLQDGVMELRVVPVDLVFKRLPRMVRDLAQSQGKRVRLELSGQDVKIDKAMVESLSDPLLHMIRNSVDHGIETPDERRAVGKPEEAVIRVQAEQQGARVVIRVIDDGRGIDPEKVRRKAVERGLVREEDSLGMGIDEILKFIFRPGFSTAEVVTETSGRGVGMDVVRTNIMRLGGNIHLDSSVGRGTSFAMFMPLSAAVQEVLLVTAANQTLAIPARYVAEVIELNEEDIQSVKGRKAVLLRGSFLPIARLDDLLGYARSASAAPHRFAVVLSDSQRMLGISVSEVLGRHELFSKDIHPRLTELPGVGGASILGDGRVVLILDCGAIYRLAENIGDERPALSGTPAALPG